MVELTLPCGEIVNISKIAFECLTFYGCFDYCPKGVYMSECPIFLKRYNVENKELDRM